MKPEVILWIYLVVLVAGGVYGYVKARSMVSLVTSLVSGALLAAAALGLLGWAHAGDLILAILVVVFAIRYQKTRKFMPAGMLTLLTIAALVLRVMMFMG
ncbi:MAG: TMEM14 family protein [Verrucomicrobiae bacterium]|nr:TMEM14 family protein [Verrucomicrobiae bacterium]